MSPGLRLLSWNTYNKRHSAEEALELCLNLTPEVLCLQEVDARLLDLLRRQKLWHLHSARDFTERGELSWLATATRSPSEGLAQPVNADAAVSPSLVGWVSRWAESLDTLWVNLPGGSLTVVNLHLSCAAGPSHRLDELRRALAVRTAPRRLIVCGDFNSFGDGVRKLLGPLFGFRWSDYRGQESEKLGAALLAAGLHLLATDRPTARFGLTLDRVAVSEDLLPGAAIEVLAERHGSDHCPVLVKLPAASDLHSLPV